MSLLRKKVDLPGEHKLLHTEKGVGYVLRIEHLDDFSWSELSA